MAQNKLGLILIYYLWISVNSSAHTKFFLGTKTWESLSTWKHEAGMSSVTHLCSLWQPPAVTPMLTQTECHHHYRKCHHQSLFSASYWSAWRGSTLMNNSQFLSRPTRSHGNKALLFPWAWSPQTASKLKLTSKIQKAGEQRAICDNVKDGLKRSITNNVRALRR